MILIMFWLDWLDNWLEIGQQLFGFRLAFFLSDRQPKNNSILLKIIYFELDTPLF